MGRHKHPIPYPPRIFKTNLAELLEEYHTDVRRLAEVAEVTPATMKHIIDGTDLRVSVARKIASYFDRDVDDIWNQEVEREI